MNDFAIEDTIPRLESLRTLIVYDSQYVVRALIFGHIVPHFSSKDLFIAVYSDTMMRRLASLSAELVELPPLLDLLLPLHKNARCYGEGDWEP